MPLERRHIDAIHEPSPLAVSDRWVALLRGDGVLLRDLGSGETRDVPVASPCGVGVLADGAFLVLSAQAFEAVRIPAGGSPERTRAVLTSGLSRVRVFPLPDPKGFLIASPGQDVWQHDLAPTRMRTLGSIAVERNGHATVAPGHGDAIVYSLPGSIVRRDLRGQTERFPLPQTRVLHLAPGPVPDLFWMTTAAQQLQLIRLADPVQVIMSFDLGGAPVHLDAAAGGAAVIIGHEGADPPFSLALYDGDRERWRVALSERDLFVPWFVAASSSYVAVLGHELAAWTIGGGAVSLGER